MYPTITNLPDLANAHSFSSCTLTAVPLVVAGKGSCLLVPNPCSVAGACCANGQLLPAGTVYIKKSRLFFCLL